MLAPSNGSPVFAAVIFPERVTVENIFFLKFVCAIAIDAKAKEMITEIILRKYVFFIKDFIRIKKAQWNSFYMSFCLLWKRF